MVLRNYEVSCFFLGTGAVRKPHLPVLVTLKQIKNGKLNSPNVETGSFHLTFSAPLEIYTHAALTRLESLETTRFYKHAEETPKQINPTGLMYERRGWEKACVYSSKDSR